MPPQILHLSLMLLLEVSVAIQEDPLRSLLNIPIEWTEMPGTAAMLANHAWVFQAMVWLFPTRSSCNSELFCECIVNNNRDIILGSHGLCFWKGLGGNAFSQALTVLLLCVYLLLTYVIDSLFYMHSECFIGRIPNKIWITKRVRKKPTFNNTVMNCADPKKSLGLLQKILSTDSCQHIKDYFVGTYRDNPYGAFNIHKPTLSCDTLQETWMPFSTHLTFIEGSLIF